MSLKFWKELGAPTIDPSHTMLKEFSGHYFPPHILTIAYPIEFGGKIITFDVEVVYMPIDYNFLLGHSWLHAMMVLVYSMF